LLSDQQKLFFRQFREEFFHTGAVLPSSKAVAQASTAYLARKQGPVQVLEAGPGTGAFTKEIIPLLEEGDSFDIVEINPVLLSYLRQRFEIEPAFKSNGVEVNLINADLCRYSFDKKYDHIISSLPLSNFPPKMVEEILTLVMDRLKPGGIFSYIHYIFIGRIKYLFSDAETRAKTRKYKEIINRFTQQYQVERRAILSNIPPTWIYYWQKPLM
jgi:phospholipid N-methyltransferase